MIILSVGASLSEAAPVLPSIWGCLESMDKSAYGSDHQAAAAWKCLALGTWATSTGAYIGYLLAFHVMLLCLGKVGLPSSAAL